MAGGYSLDVASSLQKQSSLDLKSGASSGITAPVRSSSPPWAWIIGGAVLLLGLGAWALTSKRGR